jgi:hypothetical protein
MTFSPDAEAVSEEDDDGGRTAERGRFVFQARIK